MTDDLLLGRVIAVAIVVAVIWFVAVTLWGRRQ